MGWLSEDHCGKGLNLGVSMGKSLEVGETKGKMGVKADG